MPIVRDQSPQEESSNRPIYRSSFVARSHQLLKMGYDAVDSSSFCDAEEEDITGELVRAMEECIERRDAPRWTRNFDAKEEKRLHDPRRRGKRRFRIDIQIVKCQQGKRPRFNFEAKRLIDASSHAKYLGADGLCCFLDGRYVPEERTVGMIGYVQRGTPNDHALELERKLSEDEPGFRTATDGKWAPVSIVKGLLTYRTEHEREGTLPPVAILHSLLAFLSERT